MNQKDRELLHQSLWRLAALRNQLRKALDAIRPKDRFGDNDLRFTVCNYIPILVCSFLDAWKSFSSLGHNEEIKTTLRIAKPGLDCIQKWKGLNKVRSQLLAHGFSESGRGPVAYPGDVFARYDAPTEHAEIILLGECACSVAEKALARHYDEYHEGYPKSQKNPSIEPMGIRKREEIDMELDKIKVKMSKIEDSLT